MIKKEAEAHIGKLVTAIMHGGNYIGELIDIIPNTRPFRANVKVLACIEYPSQGTIMGAGASSEVSRLPLYYGYVGDAAALTIEKYEGEVPEYNAALRKAIEDELRKINKVKWSMIKDNDNWRSWTVMGALDSLRRLDVQYRRILEGNLNMENRWDKNSNIPSFDDLHKSGKINVVYPKTAYITIGGREYIVNRGDVMCRNCGCHRYYTNNVVDFVVCSDCKNIIKKDRMHEEVEYDEPLEIPLCNNKC